MLVPSDLIAELDRVEAAERRAPTYAWNDGGTARALLDYFGPDLLAVTGSKDLWAVWDGGRWSFRRTDQLTAEFEQAVSHPLQRAAKRTPDNKDLARWANTVSNTSRMTAGIKHAHNLAQVAERNQTIAVEEFDAYPEAIGVVNGILDLSGPVPVLRSRSREWKITRSTPCEFDSTATHPALTEYLNKFLPEPDLREFVQRLLGYAALRDGNPERLMAWLRGETSTGKSTIAEWVHHTLGAQHSMTTDPSLFREKREAGATSELAKSLSRRFLVLSQFGSSSKLHVSIIKRLTGAESIPARRAHSPEVVERVPGFTPVVVTNKVPHVDDPDSAFRRRLVVVPFLHASDPNAADRRRTTDEETWPAVLAWLAQGYAAFKRVGIRPNTWPAAVQEETDRTFMDLSPGDQFWDKRVRPAQGEWVRTNVLWREFFQWQLDAGVPDEARLNETQFKRFVREQKDLTPTPRKESVGEAKKSVKVYVGIRLTDEDV